MGRNAKVKDSYVLIALQLIQYLLYIVYARVESPSSGRQNTWAPCISAVDYIVTASLLPYFVQIVVEAKDKIRAHFFS